MEPHWCLPDRKQRNYNEQPWPAASAPPSFDILNEVDEEVWEDLCFGHWSLVFSVPIYPKAQGEGVGILGAQ